MDSDSVVTSLSGLIEQFSDEMAPYAIEILQHLKSNFMRLMKIDMNQENDDDDGDA